MRTETDAVSGRLFAQVSRSVFERLSPTHQQMLLYSARRPTKAGPPFQICFAPGTPNDVIGAFQDAVFGDTSQRFQGTTRWTQTAHGSTGAFGQPIALTYSFVPDGTIVPNFTSFPMPSDLFEFLDDIYGNTATWQDLYAQMFDRWSELAGITFVFEPNDDGAAFPSSPGVLGVRGDLRMAGTFIDGNPPLGGGSILAFNFFPDQGDMVIDTGDTFYANTTQNSLGLRNVLAHEHGHGMGASHVCPVEQTKLMEPFLTRAFDGPQHDDIRGAHWRYGDPFEPNDAVASATDVGILDPETTLDLGLVPPPAVTFGATLSIENNQAQDFFRFRVDSALEVSLTLTPVGFVYDDSPQTGICTGAGSCCDGNFFDSLSVADLSLQLIDTNGSTVLATANTQPRGQPESIVDFVLPRAGAFFVRVFESDAPTEPQLYKLRISSAGPPFMPLQIVLPAGAPEAVNLDAPTPFEVEVEANDDVLVAGSATLFSRIGGGGIQSTPLTPIGGNRFTAAIPTPNCCRDTVEFYVSAQGEQTGTVNVPPGGAFNPFSAAVGTVIFSFQDDFESDMGWTVSGSASEGQWERGVPVNLDRGDPPTDADGSGRCFLTGNDPNDANSDVDGGITVLTSPVLDLSNARSISYAYWLNDNGPGALALGADDVLMVEVSTDPAGQDWQVIRIYDSAEAAWRTDRLDVGPLLDIPSSPAARLRFTARDAPQEDIVEAGLDAFEIEAVDCTEIITPPATPGLLSATQGEFCGIVRLAWQNADSADEYEVWRSLVNDFSTAQPLVEGLTVTTHDDPVGSESDRFYWVRSLNPCNESEFVGPVVGSARIVPSAPSLVTAREVSACGAVEIAWNEVADAISYKVWRSTVNVSGSATQVGTSVTTTFVDETVEVGDRHFYWVSAVNDCGDGGFSPVVLGSASGLPAPVGLEATDATVCGAIELEWQAVVGASAYQVFRNTSSNRTTATPLATSSAPTFTDATVASSSFRHYWVAALSDCGTGPLSAPATGRIGTGSPACPDAGTDFIMTPSETLPTGEECGCGTGSAMLMPMMLVGGWLIRRGLRSQGNRPR